MPPAPPATCVPPCPGRERKITTENELIVHLQNGLYYLPGIGTVQVCPYEPDPATNPPPCPPVSPVQLS